MKKGLVLEGGAMRGMFTCGVIDVMMENNIDFDGLVGVSAGAAFGCNYKSKQIGRGIRYNMQFCNDKRYCSISSLLKTGNLYNAEFCYEIVPNQYDIFDHKAFYENPMEFVTVCTDIETGKPYYKHFEKEEENMFEWFRASASLPLVSKIVEIGDKKFLDGGIVDSIPVKYFESIGFDKNVVVLTQPKDYVKKKNRAMPIMKMIYKKYPKFVDAMANRYMMYNDTLEYIRKGEESGRLFVIRPEESLKIGKTEKDPMELKRVYEIGRRTAEKQLDDMMKYLNN